MNIDSRNRNFVLIIIISLIIIILGFIGYEVFKFTQQSKKGSLSRGYGYYSDPIIGPCVNNSNDCSVPGIQKVYKKMIIHPVTRRCALQEDGTQTCDDIVEYRPCTQQCLGTQVEIFDGVQVQKVTTQQTITPINNNLNAITGEVTKELEITVPIGSGNNKIINKFGIDLTNEYLGTFDSSKNTYELKKCISESENLIFYNTETRIYKTKDESGDNSTFFTCGIDDVKAMRQNTININGQPSYDYPFVETLNGEKHYECLDILGNNQLSFLNNINIDTNFYPQPDICYEIFKEDYNINEIKLSDINLVGPTQNRITISDDNIDLSEYNLVHDFADYRLINLGKNNLIIDRIIPNEKIISKKTTNINKYIYIDCTGHTITNTTSINAFVDFEHTQLSYSLFSSNITTSNYGIFKGNFLVMNMDFFLPTPAEDNNNNQGVVLEYYYYNDNITLNNSADTVTNDDYVFYQIDTEEDDQKFGIAKVRVIEGDKENNVDDIFTLSLGTTHVPDLGPEAYSNGIKIFKLDNLKMAASISIPGDNLSFVIRESKIDTNRFFISDILINESDTTFNTNGADIDFITLTSFPSLDTDPNYFYPVYIFGTEANSDQKAFHYPLSLNTPEPNDPRYSQITFKEYNNTVFYYANVEYKTSSLPPNKLLNYKHYDDIVNTVIASVIFGSYGAGAGAEVGVYVKQLIIVSSGTNNQYTNKFSYNNHNWFLYDINDAPTNTYTIKFINTDNDFIQDVLTINSGVNNQLVEKFSIYNNFKDIENAYTSEHISISPLQSIVKKADFSVFRSPYLIRGNQTIPICFDGNNHRIPNGQKIDIYAGDKLITYKRGTEINADKYQCGVYGLSGGQVITQIRNNQILRFIEEDNIEVFDDKSRHNNHLNFLEEGYQKEDEIYCLDNYAVPYSATSNRKCKEPFLTKELSDTSNYNPNEEYFKSFTDDYYFISNNDNNNNIPQINQSWTHVSNYENIKYIRSTELAYHDKNNFKIVYSCTREGETSSNLFDLATKYVFNKQEPTYKLVSESLGNNSLGVTYASPYDTTIQKVLIKNDIDSINIGYPFSSYLYDINITSSSQNTSDSNLFDLIISLDTDGQGEIGDIFNPDFNLFNYILVRGFPLANLNISTRENYKFYTDLESTIINIDTNDDAANMKINDIVYIGYESNNLGYIYDLISNSDSYNHNFEICRVVDINNTIITLERNLLNIDPKNLLYNNSIQEELFLKVFKLPNDFNLDLNFPITGKSGNYIKFKISLYFNSNTITNNTLTGVNQNNYRFRTAASMRIFKQNISIPSQTLNNGKNIYLLEDTKLNTFSTIMSDCDIDSMDAIGQFYFREFSEDNLNNIGESIFNIGDTIAIEFQGIDYPFRIVRLNQYYNDVLYNYECIYIGDLQPIGTQTYKDILPFLYSFQLYFNIRDNQNLTDTPYIKLFSSQQATQPSNIKIVELINGSSLNVFLNPRSNWQDVDLDINNVSDRLEGQIRFQNLSFFSANENLDPYSFGTYNSGGIALYGFTSYNIDIYNSNIINWIPKVRLLSTRAYSANYPYKYITISNLEANYKPYGPYFMKDYVTTNDVDRSGYSTITSFTVDLRLANNIDDTDLVDGALFETDNGTKFSITSNNLANFQFKSASRIKNIKNYIIEKSYNKNQIIKYPINKLSFYKNISNNMSLAKIDNPPFYVYGTDTNRSQTKGYYYPLYLKGFGNTHSHNFTEFPDIEFFMPDQFINNHALPDPPNNSHYREFTNTSFQILDTWRQQSHNEYGLDILTNYNINKNYNKDSYVNYEGFVWQATANIQSGVSPTSGSDWEIIIKSRDYTNDNNETSFFNINYQDNTTVNMRKAALENVGSNPFILYNTENRGVSTFITGVNAFDYTSQFTNTFLNLPFYDDKASILGKTLMFKNNNNLISLASSPTTLTDYQNYRFLRGNKNQFNHDLLSQYLYNINLPDKNFTGKESCDGNFNHSGTDIITNYEFANSANFMIVPLDIDSQDYPSIVYDSSVNLYDMPINRIPSGTNNNISAIVMRKDSEGVFQNISGPLVTIECRRSALKNYTVEDLANLLPGLNTSKTKQNVIILEDTLFGDFRINDIWYLKENDNPAFYIYGTDTSISNNRGYYYPLYLKNNFPEFPGVTGHTHTFIQFPEVVFYMPNIFNNHALQDPPTNNQYTEYAEDVEISDKLIAYGIITKIESVAPEELPTNATNSITPECLYTISAEENYSSLNIYKLFTRGLTYEDNDENNLPENSRSRYINCKLLTELYLLSEDSSIGDLSSIFSTEYDLVTDINNNLIPPDKLWINNPTNITLLNGDKIYFLLNTANDRKQDIKCRMYGFFGKSYLSSVIYNSEKNIMSNLGISIPVMALKPYNNQLLSNLEQDIQLLDSDGSNVIISQYNYFQYNDIFNIRSKGTSLELVSHPFKKPIGAANNVFFPNLINFPTGVISTQSVTDLIAEQFDINNSVILGGVTDIIPTQGQHDDKADIYRQLKGGAALNSNLNCNIFETELNNTSLFPFGSTYNLYLLNNNGSITSKIIDSDTRVTSTSISDPFLYNYYYSITQVSVTNIGFPLYIGTSTVFNDSSIIQDNKRIDDNSIVRIAYLLNNKQVSYDKYHDLSNFNNNQYLNKEVRIVYQKEGSSNLGQRQLYMGISGANIPITYLEQNIQLIFNDESS